MDSTGICRTATLLAHVSSGSTEIWKFNFVSGLEQTCRWLLLNDLSINVYVLASECAAIKLLDFSSLAVNGISKIPYSFVLVCIVCTAIFAHHKIYCLSRTKSVFETTWAHGVIAAELFVIFTFEWQGHTVTSKTRKCSFFYLLSEFTSRQTAQLQRALTVSKMHVKLSKSNKT